MKIFTAIRALVFMSGFVGLWVWLALMFHRRYADFFSFNFHPVIVIAGWFIFAIGAVLGLACVASFVIYGEGTPAPFDAPRKFVAVGPYCYVRNPMYIGGFLALIGFGFIYESMAIVAFGLPWVLLAHIFVRVYEEPALRRQFGQEYEDYCGRVNRWIPRFHH
ncbi:isoprenylcysteine carboxylmethyltransferase family protein [bacterium]|nr:isoprenylcysteine carboxylmethyltransferase family protein [bacterium]